MKLASGFAPIRKMLDAGVAMSIIADALGLTEEEQKKLLSE